MTSVSKYAVVKLRDRQTGEIIADVCAHNNFLGWLSPRQMSKSDWEFIGKEMGWIK